jgi:hypothetical protein
MENLRPQNRMSTVRVRLGSKVVRHFRKPFDNPVRFGTHLPQETSGLMP